MRLLAHPTVALGLIILAEFECTMPFQAGAGEEKIMLKPFRPVLALTLVLSASFFGIAQQAPSGDAGARTKELYRRDCLVCHGANGDGKTGIAADRELNLPDWTDPKTLSERPDMWLFQIIRNGRGKMPAESAGRADDTEVRDLIRYIRTMSKDEATVTPPEAKK